MGKPLGTRLSQLLRKPFNAESNDDISLMTITAMMFLKKNKVNVRGQVVCEEDFREIP